MNVIIIRSLVSITGKLCSRLNRVDSNTCAARTIGLNQGDEVGGSDERCLLASNFDKKKIRGVKQRALLIAIF